MDYKALAELLFPDIIKTTDYYESIYPERNLPEGAKVTRFAPSPTGFVHFGSLFPVLVGERLARQSGGVFYLRIEDTDSKREVKGAEQDIINCYKYFGITFDEGITAGGAYAPYRQSERKEIYQTYAKKMVAEGKAYPCFCTPEELEEIRARQEAEKVTPGYYGKYVKCRDLDLDTVKDKLEKGIPYTIRYRCTGNANNKIKFTDLIKGTIELTENEIDHIILKSDGTPTYHFAHAVDDHLMRTTHVIRGEEWLPSLPYHIQLFSALGFKMPKYMHIAQLMRLEGNAKKKLSKRDKGASLSYYIQEGYAAESVLEYVMTLLNSNFEDWRRANPNEDLNKFPFSIKKMSPSGSLFDLVKLNDVSKNVVSRMSAEEVYNKLTVWAEKHDPEFYTILMRDPEYAKAILSIGRGGKNPRKDFAVWSEVKNYIGFFYNEYFKITDSIQGDFDKKDIIACIDGFLETYDSNDDQTAWFDKIRKVAEDNGFCPSVKDYKDNPTGYKGHVGDVSMFLRIAVTGKLNSPDLYQVMQVLGAEETKRRLFSFKNNI